jgi:Ca2+-binding EF-hand superfamily protein
MTTHWDTVLHFPVAASVTGASEITDASAPRKSGPQWLSVPSQRLGLAFRATESSASHCMLQVLSFCATKRTAEVGSEDDGDDATTAVLPCTVAVEIVASVVLDSHVVNISASPDGRLVAVATSDGSLHCYDCYIDSSYHLSLRWSIPNAHSHNVSNSFNQPPSTDRRFGASAAGPVSSLAWNARHWLVLVDAHGEPNGCTLYHATKEGISAGSTILPNELVTSACWTALEGETSQSLVVGTADGNVQLYQLANSDDPLSFRQCLNIPYPGGGENDTEEVSLPWSCTHVDMVRPNAMVAGYARVLIDQDADEQGDDDPHQHQVALVVFTMEKALGQYRVASRDHLGDVVPFFSVPRSGRHVFYTAGCVSTLDDAFSLMAITSNVVSEVAIVVSDKADGDNSWKTVELDGSTIISMPTMNDEFTFAVGAAIITVPVAESSINRSLLLFAATDGSITARLCLHRENHSFFELPLDDRNSVVLPSEPLPFTKSIGGLPGGQSSILSGDQLVKPKVTNSSAAAMPPTLIPEPPNADSTSTPAFGSAASSTFGTGGISALIGAPAPGAFVFPAMSSEPSTPAFLGSKQPSPATLPFASPSTTDEKAPLVDGPLAIAKLETNEDTPTDKFGVKAVEIFNQLDVSKQGSLPVARMVDLVDELGEGLHGDELKKQTAVVDPEETGFINKPAFVAWYIDFVKNSGAGSSNDDDDDEIAEERKKATDAFRALATTLDGETMIGTSAFEPLLESLGTTYCEEDHKKFALRLANSQNQISLKSFVGWYVEWLFADDDDDDDDGKGPVDNPDAQPNSTVEAEGWGDRFKCDVSGWKCGVCMITNPETTDACLACETARPGSTTQLRPVEAGGTGIGSSGFTFGGPISSAPAAVPSDTPTPSVGFAFAPLNSGLTSTSEKPGFSFASLPIQSDTGPGTSTVGGFTFAAGTFSGSTPEGDTAINTPVLAGATPSSPPGISTQLFPAKGETGIGSSGFTFGGLVSSVPSGIPAAPVGESTTASKKTGFSFGSIQSGAGPATAVVGGFTFPAGPFSGSTGEGKTAITAPIHTGTTSASPRPKTEAPVARSHGAAEKAIQVFKRFDESSSERLPLDKMEELVDELGEGLHGEELAKQKSAVDPRLTGFITRDAFVAWYRAFVESSGTKDQNEDDDEIAEEREKATTAFNTFAVAAEGEPTIDASDFEQVLEALGTTYCEEDHKKFEVGLRNSQNQITLGRFVEWYIKWLFAEDDSGDDSVKEDYDQSTQGDSMVKAEGWGNLFSSNVVGWKCEACMVMNSESATACIACEAVRPGLPVTQESGTGDTAGAGLGSGGFFFGSKTPAPPTSVGIGLSGSSSLTGSVGSGSVQLLSSDASSAQRFTFPIGDKADGQVTPPRDASNSSKGLLSSFNVAKDSASTSAAAPVSFGCRRRPYPF